MCQSLLLLGIRLTLWVHPFVNLDSENAKKKELKNYFVKGLDGEPAVVSWWHKKAYIIDFTFPEASKWFREQLEELKRVSVYIVCFLPLSFSVICCNTLQCCSFS